MNAETHTNIFEIISSAPRNRDSWIAANTNGKNTLRLSYVKAEKHLSTFADDGSSRWIIMPGLRGIGKTTILTQLYLATEAPYNRKFYVSLERIKLAGGNTSDVVSVIEELAGSSLEEIDEPLYLFLDEVQFAEDWALTLKTVYDRAPHIFIACTGSSAIALQSNPDIARRSVKIPIHPLCFTEYVMIRQAHDNGISSIQYPDDKLANDIRQALFQSSDERQVYAKLQAIAPRVSAYWKKLSGKADYIYDYFKFGTLPFTLKESETVIRWQRINGLLNESLARDVDIPEQFDSSTRSMFPRLLFLIANSDTISHAKLSDTLNINPRTVASMLDTLQQTEILNGILPRGSAYKQISKPTKYLFTSPAMRAALCVSGGLLGEEKASTLRGRLTEDAAGLYLKRLLHPGETPAILEYDHSRGGADFIVSLNGVRDESIAIEVGNKKGNARQVAHTLELNGGKYGLVVSSSPLSLDTAKRAVFVPFEFFLLT